MTFPSHPALAPALAARGYETATAVQLAVVQDDAVTRDLLVSAQTGSGKTVAFGLAIATPLLGSELRFETAAEPLALIIAPTRELAMQVQRELVWLYADTGARIVSCVGGMEVRAEARQLSFGAHIVVGTPGRLRDHLERNRLNLTKLRSIVLDEADEMLDLGFREDLEFILDTTPSERQTLLFSATMPREIEALAGRYQRDALRIQTAQRDEQHSDIEYQAIRVAPSDVENAVVNVLRYHEARTTLVFCSTREAVKRMHARLCERGFSAVALSGELSQTERTHALQTVRDGRARLLVATDVAARGLDLPDLGLVIHAELPHDRETLLHRSGRTGRAGKKGLCVLIVPLHRRRKAEGLVGAARLKVTWGAAPTADEIRARDQERFLSDPMFTEVATEEETALVRAMQAARTPDEIAIALTRMHRQQLPAPEELGLDTGPPSRERRTPMARDSYTPSGRENFRRPSEDKFKPRHDGPRAAPSEEGIKSDAPRRPKKPFGASSQDMVWFRLNIGRDRNADPRWLLPLICKAGNVSKAEVGAIKIFDKDTRFQITATAAEQYAVNVRTNGSKEGNITRASDTEPTTSAPSMPVHSVAETVVAQAVSTPVTRAPTPQTRSPERAERPAKPFQPRDSRPREGGPMQRMAPRAEHAGHRVKKPHRKGKPAPSHGRAPVPEGENRPFASDGFRPKSKYAHKKKDRTGAADKA